MNERDGVKRAAQSMGGRVSGMDAELERKDGIKRDEKNNLKKARRTRHEKMKGWREESKRRGQV